MNTHFPSGIYRIKNAKVGTYLTGSSEEPNTVYCWESRPDYEYQKWDLDLIEGTGDGAVYHLRNRGDARFLALANSGAKVCKALENPTRWVFFDPKGTGEWYIAAQGTEVVMNLELSRPCNEARINAMPKDDNSLNRRWRFKRVGDKSADGLRRSQDLLSLLPTSDDTLSGQLSVRPSADLETPSASQGSGLLPNQHTGIIPFATYSIRNAVVGDAPLNPDPDGSPKWVLQAGRQGYLFKSRKLDTYLSYDEGKLGESQIAITMSTKPIEWIIARAHKGYYIRPAESHGLSIGLNSADSSGAIPCVFLTSQTGRWKHVWRFEVANS